MRQVASREKSVASFILLLLPVLGLLIFGYCQAKERLVQMLREICCRTDTTDFRRREDERRVLSGLAQMLLRERTTEYIADTTVEQGQRIFRTNSVALFLADTQCEELRLIAHRGLSAQTVAEIGILSFKDPILTAQAARAGQPQELPDSAVVGPELALTRRIAEREGQRSIFAQPLFAEGRLVGVLTLAKPTPHHFTDWERELIKACADMCAAAVENARVCEEMRETIHLYEGFISAAAHELKTPITTLLGQTQLLLRSKAARPPEERESLQAIERQTKRVTRLVEDLLETANPLARPLQRQVFDLSALAEQEIQEAARLSERHNLILCRPGPVLVDADPDLIRRVLAIFLGNAIRFSPQGGQIEVSVTTDGNMALASVRDYGLAIAKERQRHVFEPFYEPFPSGTPGYYGATGLGLFVTRTIVDRHGGRIWFTSEEGKGSTFLFTLPLARPATDVQRRYEP